MPVINPDGYSYTFTDDRRGARLVLTLIPYSAAKALTPTVTGASWFEGGALANPALKPTGPEPQWR